MHQTFTPTQDRTPLSIRLKLRMKDGFAQTQDCLRASRFALAGSSMPAPQPVMQPFTSRFRVNR
ncbi:MAG: hypothetical protein SH809_19615 [Rhodothermales bacterium]|nr:hypothetical protein [Rhodothermales bacterium]